MTLESIKEQFTLKDLIGMSSLIFGLFLSNTTMSKTATAEIPSLAETKVEKSVSKDESAAAKTQTAEKKEIKNIKKQTMTASKPSASVKAHQ